MLKTSKFKILKILAIIIKHKLVFEEKRIFEKIKIS